MSIQDIYIEREREKAITKMVGMMEMVTAAEHQHLPTRHHGCTVRFASALECFPNGSVVVVDVPNWDSPRNVMTSAQSRFPAIACRCSGTTKRFPHEGRILCVSVSVGGDEFCPCVLRPLPLADETQTEREFKEADLSDPTAATT